MQQVSDLRYFAFLDVFLDTWKGTECTRVSFVGLRSSRSHNYFFGKYSPYRLIRPLVSLLLNPVRDSSPPHFSSVFHSRHEILIKRDIKGIKCAVIVWATRATRFAKGSARISYASVKLPWTRNNYYDCHNVFAERKRVIFYNFSKR